MRGLELLYVSQYPPSPPRSGGQARLHGLMTALARHHRLTALALAPPDELLDAAAAARAYCEEVCVLPAPRALQGGAARRVAQLASLASPRSFERLLFTLPAFQVAVDELLGRRAFDVVALESPWLAHHRFRRAPPGAPAPRLVLDEHNIEYDVLRQVAARDVGAARRAFNRWNGKKLRREERQVWRRFDGITLTSAQDERVVREALPAMPTAVVPNAVDVERFRPAPGDPPPDGSILFFGALHYVPNADGILAFLREVWPRLSADRPSLRLRVVGARPPPELLSRPGPRVEVTGLVDDVRPFLARASVVIVPLRMGGGTRLKILEAMAMGKAVVSTTIGAEGLELTPGAELLVADEPAAFGAAVARLLDDPAEARRLGQAARALAVARYSWSASAARLERFLRELLGAGEARARGARPPAPPFAAREPRAPRVGRSPW